MKLALGKQFEVLQFPITNQKSNAPTNFIFKAKKIDKTLHKRQHVRPKRSSIYSLLVKRI